MGLMKDSVENDIIQSALAASAVKRSGLSDDNGHNNNNDESKSGSSDDNGHNNNNDESKSGSSDDTGGNNDNKDKSKSGSSDNELKVKKSSCDPNAPTVEEGCLDHQFKPLPPCSADSPVLDKSCSPNHKSNTASPRISQPVTSSQPALAKGSGGSGYKVGPAGGTNKNLQPDSNKIVQQCSGADAFFFDCPPAPKPKDQPGTPTRFYSGDYCTLYPNAEVCIARPPGNPGGGTGPGGTNPGGGAGPGGDQHNCGPGQFWDPYYGCVSGTPPPQPSNTPLPQPTPYIPPPSYVPPGASEGDRVPGTNWYKVGDEYCEYYVDTAGGRRLNCVDANLINKTECHGAAISLERCFLVVDPNDPSNIAKWKFVNSPFHTELNPDVAKIWHGPKLSVCDTHPQLCSWKNKSWQDPSKSLCDTHPQWCDPPSGWHKKSEDEPWIYCNVDNSQCVFINSQQCLDASTKHCKLVVDPLDPDNIDKWRLIDIFCISGDLSKDSCDQRLNPLYRAQVWGCVTSLGASCLPPNPLDPVGRRINNGPFYGLISEICAQALDTLKLPPYINRDPDACAGLLTSLPWAIGKFRVGNPNPNREPNPTQPWKWLPPVPSISNPTGGRQGGPPSAPFWWYGQHIVTPPLPPPLPPPPPPVK
jgi:hypothetical protein